ncbi:MAG: 16S rRNA processing protein RimM [Planctomycetales bacterium 4484_113]|nr:MAG: 16S rRNA processing protein RimM [Planctomycetales bacterium 4484_113]
MGSTVTVGRVGRPHGVRGALRCTYETDFPERLRQRESFLLCDPRTGEVQLVTLSELKLLPRHFLIRFQEISSPEEARRFIGWWLEIDARRVPDDTEEGEFYYFQLSGLTVVEEGSGRVIGRVVDVNQGKAHEILTIETPDGEELLIPFVADAVAEVSVDDGRLILRSRE